MNYFLFYGPLGVKAAAGDDDDVIQPRCRQALGILLIRRSPRKFGKPFYVMTGHSDVHRRSGVRALALTPVHITSVAWYSTGSVWRT